MLGGRGWVSLSAGRRGGGKKRGDVSAVPQAKRTLLTGSSTLTSVPSRRRTRHCSTGLLPPAAGMWTGAPAPCTTPPGCGEEGKPPAAAAAPRSPPSRSSPSPPSPPRPAPRPYRCIDRRPKVLRKNRSILGRPARPLTPPPPLLLLPPARQPARPAAAAGAGSPQLRARPGAASPQQRSTSAARREPGRPRRPAPPIQQYGGAGPRSLPPPNRGLEAGGGGGGRRLRRAAGRGSC